MRKFRRNYIVVPLLTVIIVLTAISGVSAYPANENTYAGAERFSIAFSDTVPLRNRDTTIIPDSLQPGDTTLNINDTTLRAATDTFSLKLSRDTLTAPIEYEAEDSVVGLVEEKIIILHGKAKTTYDDMELNAPVIELDQSKNLVRARSGTDSTGAISEYAEMKQGENQFQSESMEYNFKTMRGLTKGTITQQGEMFVHSDIVKKVDERTMYGLGTFFTTCNLDHPHFGFRAKRAKIVNQKLAVTGAVRPEFDSVPVPIYLPFGFYPLYQGRHAGFLAPSFETVSEMGLGLQGFGYYFVLNDHWDVQVEGSLYSSGSWSVNARPTYRKIYKYQGSASLGWQHTQRGRKGDPDLYKVNTYQLNWSHSSDMRSRPGTSFSASVNASSTKYNENIPTSNLLNFQNALGSSITYSKTWQDRPFNLSVSANHNQVNVSRTTTISFPNIAFNMNTLYPFERKEAVGSKKWYEQLGVGYQFSFRNSVAFYDTVNYKLDRGHSIWKHLWDTTQWGASNSIPITLSLPPILGGAVNVSPSVSYSFDIVDRKTDFEYQQVNGRDTVIAKSKNWDPGLRHRASMGLGFNTALFGKFNMKNGSQLRHVVRPTLGFSYTPDLSRNQWRPVKVDSSGTTVWYNRMDPSPYLNRGMSQFTPKQFAGLTFSFDNNLEMKKRIKKKAKEPVDSIPMMSLASDSTGRIAEAEGMDKDKKEDFKKIRLIEGFGFNTSYNLIKDSLALPLAPLSMYLRTNLFDKININTSATFVPYVLNTSGMATRTFAWKGDKFGLGSFTNANVSMSTSFQSKPKDPEKDKRRQDAVNEALNDPMMQADQQRLLEYMRTNPAEFVDFNTPWSVNLSFQLSYNRGAYDTVRYKWDNRITSSTMFGGSFNLTPKWNFSVNGGYDFSTMSLQTVSMSISRDLHCWQMSLNVSPVGRWRYFSFTISPKAGILQDLKINRNRSFHNGPNY